jgi:hypothetical protein
MQLKYLAKKRQEIENYVSILPILKKIHKKNFNIQSKVDFVM